MSALGGSLRPGSDMTGLTAYFESLGNPVRMRMIQTLAELQEVRVSLLAELCRVSQPRASWHLRHLKRAGVVRTRRQGREVFCCLDRDRIAEQLHRFERLLALGLVPGTGTAIETVAGHGAAGGGR